MRRLVLVAAVIVVPLANGGPGVAQANDALRINVVGSEVAANGGEKVRVGTRVDAANAGKTTWGTISHFRTNGPHGCGNFIELSPTDPSGGTPDRIEGPDGRMTTADSAWVFDVTPVAVTGDAATFTFHWVRSRDNGRPSTQPTGRTELTLRPGQSIPLDIVTSPPPAGSNEPCVRSLRVGVERHPLPDRDRRLAGADLWLIERLANGTERTHQALSLRGVYNHSIPFYFDSIIEGAAVLDLFGDLQLTPGKETGGATITLKSRVDNPANPMAAEFFRRTGEKYTYVGSTSVTTPLVADEVVSVALPKIGEGRDAAGAFANRTLSLRIRVRQLR
jgi:hypothetical protein